MTEKRPFDFVIPLDELLAIAEPALRKWLRVWQEDNGNPLEYPGDVEKCKIEPAKSQSTLNVEVVLLEG